MGKFFKESSFPMGIRLIADGAKITGKGLKNKSSKKIKDGLRHMSVGAYEVGALAVKFVPGGPGVGPKVLDIAKKYVI